jgi:hypothetical protein
VGVAAVIEEAKVTPHEFDEFVRDRSVISGEQNRTRIRIMGSIDPELGRDQIQNDPRLQNLSILRLPRGTNFPVTPEEAQAIEELLASRTKGDKAMENDNSSPLAAEFNAVKARIAQEGFHFPDSLIKNYLISLRAKPFVLLTGLSGNGKTALPRIVAQALREEYQAIAVRPNCTDARDLLGFYNSIMKEYVTQPALKFILEAA